MTADSFRARIKPFMLRRMKSDVLNELPEKIENTMYAELTGEQKKMYTSYLALAKNQTLALLGEGGQGKAYFDTAYATKTDLLSSYIV